MDTYHIFAIKKDIYNTYKNNSYSLYKTLYNLYNTNKEDLKLGISIYNQLCFLINTKKIKEYIELAPVIRKTNSKYLIVENSNKTILIIKHSNIICKYEKINKNIFYILNNCYGYLFACNFQNNDYYWANEL